MADRNKDNKDTLLRQWVMLRHIPRGPRRIDTATLRKHLLAAGFDITLRSIQRDLVNLSTILPLAADNAKPQGWYWLPDCGLKFSSVPLCAKIQYRPDRKSVV